jgi:hypothetical protein
MHATADYITKRYYIVIAATGNYCTLSAASTLKTMLPIGVIQDAGAGGIGAATSVCILGECLVISGGDITVGQLIASDANGAAVRADTDATIAFGWAMETAASGDIFHMFVTGPNSQGVDLI